MADDRSDGTNRRPSENRDGAARASQRQVPPRYIVRRNVLRDFYRVEWARSATRHRISRRRIRSMLEGDCVHLVEAAPRPGLQRRHVFLGEDEDQNSLEVIAVRLSGGDLLVIHAMPMRERYRFDYEEAMRWRSRNRGGEK